MPITLEEREIRTNISWTSKIADATVVRRQKRPRITFEQMRRGQLRPAGISPANMVYVRYHAAQMVKKFKRYDRMQMTPQEQEIFESEIMRFKTKPLSENFAMLAMDVRRVEGKVEQVIQILDKRLPPKP